MQDTILRISFGTKLFFSFHCQGHPKPGEQKLDMENMIYQSEAPSMPAYILNNRRSTCGWIIMIIFYTLIVINFGCLKLRQISKCLSQAVYLSNKIDEY